ncbi:ATP-binding protein [Actinomycetospora termitidis]|uniref:histidine kinase n=1 Tax=Actinomycetospora termitidis TaxID=3053470 RepID=A0ABT7M4H0_9PSEU|nr:ATP-binding protein [Actinomycetospora sp. Odt1-22]MDL5155571.1 ATP-binding protein [Actinomycetospora sp. Odt1-22]
MTAVSSASDTDVLLGHQHRVLELLAGGAARREVLEAVTTSLEELIPGSRCSILVLDPVAGTLHHGAAPSLPAEYSAAIDGMAIGDDAGSCGTAAHTGRAVVAEDVAVDERWARYRYLALPHGLGSCWSSPIRLGRGGVPHDEVLGTFAVYHEAGHRPDERERRLVARFTDLAAVALEHDRLYGALAQSEERFRRAFEDNAVGMALTDLDGRFLKVNPALARMVGREPADLLAADLTALVRREDRAGARLLLRGLADGSADAGPGPLEVVLTRRDGSTLTASLSASVVGAGAARHVSLNVVDVTARRAAQRDRIARREAELAARVAEDASRAKSEMLSTLSHELRTPLQAVIGFAELLGTLDLPPERRAAALGHIDTAARHVLDLVNDVLDLARLEARALPLSPAPVVPGEVVGEVVELLEPLMAERGISVGLPDGGCGPVFCDRRRLRQVLINLVTNGVRHNHPDGWVQVDAHDDGGEVVVAVRDGGPGIAPTLIDRLFVPFDQLDTDRGGSGLGLALVRGLVEAMSGTVAVASAPGEGTTVTVRLPAAGASAVGAPAAGAGVRSGRG